MSPAHLFGGTYNISFDRRKFDPSKDDIEGICRFFSIGKLLHYKKEKDIIISHNNFFVFVATTQGQYALKFYPMNAAQRISTEYAINRVLIDHHFPTPDMHAGHGDRPFFTGHDLLVTCYSYIDGSPAWKHIKERNTIHQINAAMLSLKYILSSTKGRIPLKKRASLMTTINALAQKNRALSPGDRKETIDASLLDACRTYQQHQPLFTRQRLYNNAVLPNFLIYKKTVYTVDLEHSEEDYALSDLATMVFSCLVLDIPAKTIKTIIKDYFTQHKINPERSLVLNTLVEVGLIEEYLKNIQSEKSIKISAYPPDLVLLYRTHLSARKKSIIAILKNMNDAPGLIV